MTKEELTVLIYKAFPYSEQISHLDFSSEEKAVRFHWRGTMFRVSTDMFVEEVGDGVLSGSNLAMLAEALLKRAHFQMENRQAAKV